MDFKKREKKYKQKITAKCTWLDPDIFFLCLIFGTRLLRSKRCLSVAVPPSCPPLLGDDHSCGPQRNLKAEKWSYFGQRSGESGTHYDSLPAEMCRMMSESDTRASVRCHGDARAKCKWTQRAIAMEMKWGKAWKSPLGNFGHCPDEIPIGGRDAAIGPRV